MVFGKVLDGPCREINVEHAKVANDGADQGDDAVALDTKRMNQ
jgi:hypothetical protein